MKFSYLRDQLHNESRFCRRRLGDGELSQPFLQMGQHWQLVNKIIMEPASSKKI